MKTTMIAVPMEDCNFKGPQRGAWKKGWIAHFEGKNFSDCPYKDKKSMSGRITFSRSFRKAWQEGWTERERHEEGKNA